MDFLVCICTAQETTTIKTKDTVDDNTHGKNGKKITIVDVTKGSTGETITTNTFTKIYDPRGVEREFNLSNDDVGGRKREMNRSYDGSHTQISESEIYYDLLGQETERDERRYKDGKQISGYHRFTDAQGKKHNQIYDSKTQKYEDKDVSYSPSPENSQVSTQPTATLFPILLQSNEIFFGPSFMHFGDKEFHYNSFGGTIEYTRFINPRWGGTLDIGAYFHNENSNGYSQDYSRYNITAGPTFIPCSHSASPDAKLRFGTHALFGVSIYKETDKSGCYSTPYPTMKAFTFNAGADADLKLSSLFSIRQQADYAQTFFSHKTQNNYRITLGVAMRI